MTEVLTNSALAELLAQAASGEEPKGHRRRALDRASGAALRWPVSAVTLRATDRPLSELEAVGPWTAALLEEWIERSEPAVPESVPAVRRGFISLAEAREVLATAPDVATGLRGDLQTHSTWSDGRVSLVAMVSAAAQSGRLEYLAITDHSQGLRVANGMSPQRLLAQAQEVETIDRTLATSGGRLRKLLHAIEMNLDVAGQGDMDAAALAPLDLVLGAFHDHLREAADQTDRYLAAVRNPLVDVLAHPRTRMWDRRAGLQADWDRVFWAAAEAGTAVEIDGHPNRQDLDLDTLRIAAATPVLFSIGSDAHAPDELVGVDIALAMAVRAGIEPERILPMHPPEQLRPLLLQR